MTIQAKSYQQTPSWFVSQDSQLDQQRLTSMHLQRKNQILSPTQNQRGIEFDQFLHFQTNRLRVALQQQMKQHTTALLNTLESKTQLILNQKEQELAAATQRTAQLQNIVQKLETEGHAWRRAAEENEAVVASLNNTLEELSRDRESHCDGTGDNQVGVGTDLCKSCKTRGSCVLFLPCRHLCSCKPCEPLLGVCPVCRTPKKATVEAIF